ncbi:hypothetical protein MIND_01198100 [Mycena indigotica]|uniref:Uncharacterized protein n=1 Tax=Mycena indigotica TaxID=2126181 RepID=A0A8H6S613_9AGAR|nr:uncharacterized protein MIND_01198100 [Mycena indigotica]KAF7292988.1 hypothetical protein MIND_01198100 [Mycena indigotica]
MSLRSSSFEGSGIAKELNIEAVATLITEIHEQWLVTHIPDIPNITEKLATLQNKAIEAARVQFSSNSHPFTDSSRFLKDVFQEGTGSQFITISTGTETITPSSTLSYPSRVLADILLTSSIFKERAAAFQNCTECHLWDKLRKHARIELSERHRSLTDPVLTTAAAICQEIIAENQVIDEDLKERYALQGPTTKYSSGSSSEPTDISAWVVLDQEVAIPSQCVATGINFHGTLDHVMTIVNAEDALACINAGQRLSMDSSYLPTNMALNVTEAKAMDSMNGKATKDQVLSEGAAVCVFTRRNAVVNALTNGLQWRFYLIRKTPQSQSETPKADDMTPSPTKKPRRSDPQSETNSAKKPFTYSETFNLSVIDNLELILKLLVLATIGNANDFVELVKYCRKS